MMAAGLTLTIIGALLVTLGRDWFMHFGVAETALYWALRIGTTAVWIGALLCAVSLIIWTSRVMP